MPDPRLTRRGLLAGSAATVAGALSARVSGRSLPTGRTGLSTAAPGTAPRPPGGSAAEPFHGVHQAGIATLPQAHAVFVGLDLLPGTDREAIGRMMRLLTGDARRLTRGRPALADTEPELAALPARLTVTFGFGPGLAGAWTPARR